MFSIQFSSSCKTKLGVFLCVLCVVLIFECILLQCEFAKDIISLNFSFTVFFPFFVFNLLTVTNYIQKTGHN